MGWGGRSLALLSFATFLLISASAVSGNIHVKELLGRSGRDHVKHVAIEGKLVAKEVSEAVSLDEEKPAEGILEKARSFLSGLSNPIGHGILPHHLASPFEKKKVARAEEEEKSDIRRHAFGRHHRFAHSRWAGIRDLIRSHPERLADISATEPVYRISETSVSAFQAKLYDVVETALWGYKFGILPVTESGDSTCAGALEDQVRVLVKSVKSKLREQLCNGDVASMEEQRFCNVFNDHPMLATLEVFAKTSTNPIYLLMRQTKAMAACSSVNPFTDYMDSLNEMEGLALKALLSPEVRDNEDMHMEHDREHLMFNKHRHEREDHERHWWQWMLPKQHLHFDKEYHKEENHEWHHERKEGEHVHEHKDHEKHWWHRMFPMFHEHRRHHGFEHSQMKSGKDHMIVIPEVSDISTEASEITWQPRVRQQHPRTSLVLASLQRSTDFLVKTWLAVKMPVWREAAKKCTSESLPVTSEEMIRVAPDLPELALSEAAHTAVNPIYPIETVSHNVEGMMQHFKSRSSRSCARKLANPALNKGLYLRGHVVGISHSNDDLGLPGLIRTQLVVLREHPRLHHHVGEETVDISELLDRLSSGDMLSKIQDRLEALNGAASSERQTVSDMAEKTDIDSFQHYTKGAKWMHRNFRISANPRVLPTSEGLHFRISAKPRPVAIVDADGETESTGMAGSEVELRMKTAKDTTENRADM